METLKPLMDEILETKADMAIEPNDADPRVRAGVEGRVRNAAAKLPELERKYRDNIKNHVVLIGVNGEGAQEFANIAKYVFKTAVVEYDVLNKRLETNFKNRSARADFNNQESYMLLDELAKLKHEFGIYNLPNPSFQIGNQNIFGENTYKVIDQVLKHNYGHQLHSIALMNEIYRVALASHFGGKLLPVIVYSNDATVDQMIIDTTILPKLHNVFTIDKTVNDEIVKAVLEDVKKSLNVKPSQSEIIEPALSKTESIAPEELQEKAVAEEAIEAPKDTKKLATKANKKH